MRVRLAAFKAEHGHCRVPQNHPTDPQLGGWVGDQRKYKKRLAASQPNPKITAERLVKLEALGFEWATKYVADEAGWEAMLARLAAFKAEHGHCWVSQNYPTDPQLGRWSGPNESARRAGDPNPQTTAGRVAKLEALGFEWSPHLTPMRRLDEASWEAMRDRLTAFKAEHGHCRVPGMHPADPKLGRWVNQQRQRKKKLAGAHPSPMITVERVAKLEALGFEWVVGKGNYKR